jgi:SDR family mycofactocin-dependent oxidoreductase
MGKLNGKTAFITGIARGQGRMHALTLAREGADIIGVDICQQIDSVGYPLATPEDLAETVRLVEQLDRRVVATAADVRDSAQLTAALDAGVLELGGLDIVVANAGIAPFSLTPCDEEWQDALDVNLTGVYNTVRAAIPHLTQRSAGGAIVITSSSAGLTGMSPATPGGLGYTASKHALVGLMRVWANELAQHSIRVNTVHPSGVNTPMIVNETMMALIDRDPDMATAVAHPMPVAMLEPEDIANAVAWLVSDDARYVTGVALPVDAGFTNKR